jgi:type IV secretory pathway ATPase VirB11/archaellum biosynthesis ATPase/DNA-binding transcriptional regulator YiaG
MVFKMSSPLYSVEVQRKEGENLMYVNYLGAPYVPSIAENPEVMGRVIDALIENANVARIIFVQQRNYNYPFNQVEMLSEIARIYNHLVVQEQILSLEKLRILANVSVAHGELTYLITLLRQDPFACYLELKRMIAEYESEVSSGTIVEEDQSRLVNYIRLLKRIKELLDGTKLIKFVFDVAGTYVLGDREVYTRIFRPDILPNFTYTRLVAQLPKDAELIDQYEVDSKDEKVIVTILRREGDSRYLYHIRPAEYALTEEHHMLLNLGRGVLVEHEPKSEEFSDPDRVRSIFFNIARDLLSELAQSKGIPLNYRELGKLAKILVRQTIGFGIIEVLLMDDKLQDVFLNAPIAQNPIFVRHAKYEECVTNIIPSYEDAESWAAKLRLQSGRPLDEANPVLDTDLYFGDVRARVAAIQKPLSPSGIAYALRRHRDKPWTLPLFIDNKMLDSFTSGLLSFMVDGSRTMLVAGTRSSGKCVDGNTLIQLSDGRIKEIRDLIGKKKRSIEDGNIYSLVNEMSVKTLNGMKISHKKITDVWKRKSPEKVIKLRTKSGKEIVTTKEHPYFIYNQGMRNVRADELAKGDLIASPRILNMNTESVQINLRDNPDLVSEENDHYLLRGKTNSLTVKFPKKLTSELAEFLGFIIGDGHLTLTKLEFHNNNRFLRDRYIYLIKMFGLPYKVIKSHTSTVVQVTSRILNRVLNEIFEIPFGKKSDKVFIPELILRSDNHILASFLRSYFDADGYCPKGKRDLELATASRKMSEHLSLALLRFGIIVLSKSRCVRGFRSYRVLIRGNFVNEFAKYIGFLHPKKKLRLNEISNTDFMENTNVDVVPDGNILVKGLRKSLRISPKQFRNSGKDYWAYENDQYRVSRNWFKRILDFYKNRYEQISLLNPQVELLRKFSRFNLRDFLEKFELLRKFAGLSYGVVASSMGLSETGVRKCLQLKRVGDLNTANKLFESLKLFGNKNLSLEGEKVLSELAHERLSIDSISAGISLMNLRNELNISNEEFASAGVSVGTVSNLFNGVYNSSFKSLQLIVKKAVEVYDSVVSERTENLVSESLSLASSEIFWDEVSSVDLIDKVDDFVYDLTVEDTHNFVANGLIAHNTSLLGSLMLEIMPKVRIVLLEDTLEIPVDVLRKVGYNIQRMKVRSALVKGTTEVEASEGIRASLRLGDSALIVGEVRSDETKSLYEAMRVGALANVVAGTIHGASPYGVFDRVVNDLKVPVTSFKATDLIVVANPIKTPDGLHSMKRVVQVAEVRKHWTKDPLEEKGFVDLVNYNVEKDALEPTEDLINGNSEIIKSIAGNVKGWAGSWDAVYDNIILRGKIKQEMVNIAKKLKNPELIEAKPVVLSNDMFHKISDKISSEIGLPVSDRVFPEWKNWFMKYARGKK